MKDEDRNKKEFTDSDVLKFPFYCPICGREHYHELTDERIDSGRIGPSEVCWRCQINIDEANA